MTWPKVMVTGHRPQHLNTAQQHFADDELSRIALKLRAENATQVAISGMALGADQWWASAALAARLELWAFIPFPQQAEKWSIVDQRTWEYLRGRAAKEMVIAGSYSVQALHARNDTMLNFADLVVAAWDPRITSGGTASCVRKAMSRGAPILHVNLETMTTTMRRPDGHR